MQLLRQTEAGSRGEPPRPAIVLHTGTHRVFAGGAEVRLTPMEYRLLETLARNRGLALSRDRLLELVWGCDFAGGTRTVDIHVSRLRAKLDLHTELETVFKYGYCLTGARVQLQNGGP